MIGQAITGQVKSTVKIINYQPFMVRCTLSIDDQQPLNCICVHHALDFLAYVRQNMKIAIYGHFNQRNQFVIQKFMLLHANVA